MLFWKLDVTLWIHRTVLTKWGILSAVNTNHLFKYEKKTTRKTNEKSINLDAVIRQLYQHQVFVAE